MSDQSNTSNGTAIDLERLHESRLMQGAIHRAFRVGELKSDGLDIMLAHLQVRVSEKTLSLLQDIVHEMASGNTGIALEMLYEQQAETRRAQMHWNNLNSPFRRKDGKTEKK